MQKNRGQANLVRSMFRKFPKKRGYLKALVYGEPGTEKTRRALRMPGPIYVIDMENGATDYGELLEGKEAYLLSSKSHVEVVTALKEILALPEGSVGTLVIDPITQVWLSLQQGHIEKASRKKRCAPEDVFFDVSTWGKLKRSYGDLMSSLLSAPFHVILTARGKERIDEKGRSLGYFYEGEKGTAFLANVVIESRSDGDIIVKDRTGTIKDIKKRPRVEFTRFLAAEPAQTKMDSDSLASEMQASSDEEAKHHPSWDSDRKRFFVAIKEFGLKYDDVVAICEKVKRPRPSCMPQEQRAKLVGWLRTEYGPPDDDSHVSHVPDDESALPPNSSPPIHH